MSIPNLDGASLIEANFVAAAGTLATLTMPLGMNTTEGNAVILIAVTNTADSTSPTPNFTTVSSITGGGLAFTRYAEAAISNASYSQATMTPPFYFNNTGGIEGELWWAPAPAPLTDAVFTINMAADIVAAGVAGIAVYGCANFAAPWDVNGSLPAANAEPTGGASVTLSTSSIDTALILISAVMLDPIVNTDPSPEANLAPGIWTSAGGPFSGSPTGPAPSYGLSINYQDRAITVTGLDVTTPAIQGPLNGIILLAGALVGTGPETPALNMANVVVTSLATESPCTVAEYSSAPVFSPALGLRWSDTRGQTFGNPVAQPFGTGNPLTQPQWNRTGYARDRVFELFWSAAAKTALNGAFVIVEPWKS